MSKFEFALLNQYSCINTMYRFSDLTGIDYSEGAIELARNLAIRDGFEHINFLVSKSMEHIMFTSISMFIWHVQFVPCFARGHNSSSD
jgi:hypothetical protein